jgi:hypothetical protein
MNNTDVRKKILVREMDCWRCEGKHFRLKSGMRHLEKRLEEGVGGERRWTRWETDIIRACSSNGRRKLSVPVRRRRRVRPR